MEEGLLSLKWNNHKITFFNLFQKLRQKDTCTDVTISCGHKFFNVHKLVLMACSDFFYELFEQSTAKFQNSVIVLKDMKSSELEALLDYMYIGEVEVQQKSLPDIIKAAESLRIKGLAVPDDDSITKAKSKSTERPFKRKRLNDCNISSDERRFDALLHSTSSRKKDAASCSSQVNETQDLANSLPQQTDEDRPDKCNIDFPDNSDQSTSLFDSTSLDFPNFNNKIETDSSLIGSTLIKSEDDAELTSTDYFPTNDDISSAVDPSSSRIQSDAHSYDPIESGECRNIPLSDFPDLQDQFTLSSSHLRDSPQSYQLNPSTLPRRDELLGPDGIPFCPHCHRTFSDRYKRDRHLLIHTGEKPFQCPMCPYRASRKDPVVRHFRLRHRETLSSAIA